MSSRQIDVLIVTAIRLEFDAVLEVSLGALEGHGWKVETASTGLQVAFREFHSVDGGILRVAVTYALDMGGVATAMAAVPLILDYSPRCLAMCGVCAGRRGEVQLGDVIVADRLWTYDTGSTASDVDSHGNRTGRFSADPFNYNLHAPWKQRAEGFSPNADQTWIKDRPRSYENQGDWLLNVVNAGENPEQHSDRPSRCGDYAKVIVHLRSKGLLESTGLALTEKGRTYISDKLLLHPDGLPDREPLRVRVGPIGTGTQVVRDSQIFERLSDRMRKVLGLEMEAAAIGAIAHQQNLQRMIVMKGVMDHADDEKNDNFKKFAARASAECLIAFLRENLETTSNAEAVIARPILSGKLAKQKKQARAASKRNDVDKAIRLGKKVQGLAEAEENKAEATIDFMNYASAELSRIQCEQLPIERTLRAVGFNSSQIVGSSKITETYQNGAMISAPSGMGKTTLATQLVRETLENYVASTSILLACQLWAPDIAALKKSPLDFIRDRIAAKCPAITLGILRGMLRDTGLILICDGLDRLTADDRVLIEAELRTLTRDYPKLQLFLFSRPGVPSNLDIERLALLELTKEQQAELFSRIRPNERNARVVLYKLPGPLKLLLFNPLLLSLVAKYGTRTAKGPVTITRIFSSWLEEILMPTMYTPSERVKMTKALELIALETIVSPILHEQALTLLQDHGLDTAIFDKLLSCDAIVQGTSTIELQHETLADYLHALHISSNKQSFAKYLEQHSTPKDSLLPILLMSLLKTRDEQKALWNKLLCISFDTYLNALRFRADIGQQLSEVTYQESVTQYLRDLLEGLDEPLSSFFPQMRDAVLERLTGNRGMLGICGELDLQKKCVSFSFKTVTQGEPVVEIGSSIERTNTSFSVNLGLSGLRIDSGRLLAAKTLQESLLEAVSNRNLKGGKHWVTERLLGRVRLLEENYFGIAPRNHSLDELAKHLISRADCYVQITSFTRKGFSVADVLADIRFLQSLGEKTLEHWWLPYVDPLSLRPETLQQKSSILNEHFRRSLLTYVEVCENNLNCFFDQLSCSVAPVRWKVQITNTGVFGSSMHYQWYAVKDWSQIGADVEFVEKTSLRDEKMIVESLTALGRRSEGQLFSVGFSPTPIFDGRSYNSAFDGETSVLREVCEDISRDIKVLFHSLPSSDQIN